MPVVRWGGGGGGEREREREGGGGEGRRGCCDLMCLLSED